MHDLKIMYDVGKVRMQEFVEQAERMDRRGSPEPGGALVGTVTPSQTDNTLRCSSTHAACTASP